MVHIDEDKKYGRLEVVNIVDRSPLGFPVSTNGSIETLTTSSNNKILHNNEMDKEKQVSNRTNDTIISLDDYTTRPRKRSTSKSARDLGNREFDDLDISDDEGTDFEVEVVDFEIPYGPKPAWTMTYNVLFLSSSPAGQGVAVFMLILVSMSVVVAVLDSVNDIRDVLGNEMLVMEIVFTIVFTVEYVLRVACLKRPLEFIFSLLGFIDLCALVPTYLGLLIPSARPLVHLAVLRIFRVMRVFRVLRLARFVDASAALSENIQSNKRRILVFLIGLFTMILVIGCAMYLIEGDENGFSNIPISLYWAVVTITTVGYGDIAPKSIMGRILATFVMFSGYGVIACPLVLNHVGTAPMTTSTSKTHQPKISNECPSCYQSGHQEDANFCRICGTALRKPRKTKKMDENLKPLESGLRERKVKAQSTSTNGINKDMRHESAHQSILMKELSPQTSSTELDFLSTEKVI